MNAPTWIRTALDARGMRYRECHHSRASTAQEVAHREHISGHRVAKVVIVIADGKPVELVLPASRKVLLDRVRRLLGAREVRLATEVELEKLFRDCEVGTVPPLEHGPYMPLIMDKSLEGPGDILFQAGTHRDAIRMAFQDWFAMTNPRVEYFSTPAEPPPRDAIIRADL